MPKLTIHDRRAMALARARGRIRRWGAIAEALARRGDDIPGLSHARHKEQEAREHFKALLREQGDDS